MGSQSVDSTELLRVGLRAGHHGDLPIILAVYRRIFLCLLTLCECVVALFQGVVASFRAGSYNRRRTYFGSFFLFGYVFLVVWVRARSLGFWFWAFWPWPLDFLQPRGLEHTAFLSCMASWLLGFLSFLAFRPLGFLASRLLTASCVILDYVTM